MLPVALEEIGVSYMFFTTFFFSLSLSIGKKSNLAKILGGCSPPRPQPPSFYWPALLEIILPKTFLRHLIITSF